MNVAASARVLVGVLVLAGIAACAPAPDEDGAPKPADPAPAQPAEAEGAVARDGSAVAPPASPTSQEVDAAFRSTVIEMDAADRRRAAKILGAMSPPAAPSCDGSAESAVRVKPHISGLEAKGYRLDLAAYEGLDCGILEADLRYFTAAVEAAGGRLQVQRKEYGLERRLIEKEFREQYGHLKPVPTRSWTAWEGVEQGCESLPVKLAPAPARLETYLRSLSPAERQRLNLPDIALPFDEYVKDGRPYARGVYFVAGPGSEKGRYWCPTRENWGQASWTREQPNYYAPREMGKVVGHDDQLVRVLKDLRLDDPRGAKLLGRMGVLGVTKGVYLVESERPGEDTQRYLAYPIADGNGLPHRRRVSADPQSIGPYENAVRSPIHDPRLGRHSLLKVPCPQKPQAIGEAEQFSSLPWSEKEERRFRDGRRMKPPYPQERIVVTPPFAEQDPPVVVLRKDDGWEPFREDFVLDNRLSFEGEDEDTARLLCVFTNISPRSLIKLVGVLHQVDVGPLLKNEALLASLEALRPAER